MSLYIHTYTCMYVCMYVCGVFVCDNLGEGNIIDCVTYMHTYVGTVRSRSAFVLSHN